VGYNDSTVEEQVATRGGLFCFAEDQRKGTLEKETQRAFSLAFFIATQKGVSTMTQKRSFSTLSDEQTLAWYQHHVQVLHGYALALALKAGLSAAEAATFWCESHWHGDQASLQPQATPQLLEQQAKQIAEVLALTHGEEHVHVEQQGDTWLVEVTIGDREPLERYGASLEIHTQWIAEQVRLVCEPKGIRCSVWLDQVTQSLHLSLQAGH
jgi:hypothetical protein